MLHIYKLTRHLAFEPDRNLVINIRLNYKLNFKIKRAYTERYSKSHMQMGMRLWNELSGSNTYQATWPLRTESNGVCLLQSSWNITYLME